MANLFIKQAKQYAESRPGYSSELFRFISSKTLEHDLAWDVGTGSGQAARSLAGIYKNVVATDTSAAQLKYATLRPNIRYKLTSPTMSLKELSEKVGAESSVDLVTVATALHWFDLGDFYKQVKWVLKKPHGVIAAWCYNTLEVNSSVDDLFRQFRSDPCWDPRNYLVFSRYETVEFPFEALDGLDGTGPFRFANRKMMSLDQYLNFLKSCSVYVISKEKGIDILSQDIVEELRNAWSSDGNDGAKLVNFPLYLRIGKVGSSELR